MLIHRIEHTEDCMSQVGHVTPDGKSMVCRECGQEMTTTEVEGDDIPEEFRPDAPQNVIEIGTTFSLPEAILETGSNGHET